MTWQFPPHAWPPLVAAAISAIVAVYVLRRRHESGALPLGLLMCGVTVWSLGAALEASSVFLADKIFWANVAYVGIVVVPAAWLLFALQYTGRGEVVTSQRLRLLAIEPILVLLLAWSDGIHGLMRGQVSADTSRGFSVLATELGPLFWVHVAYSYVLLLAGCIVLVRAVLRAPSLYRGQVVALFVGGAAPWVANVAYLAGWAPLIDPTPIAFAVTGLAVAWAIFRYRLTDIVPVARGTVMKNLSDGVVVIDARGRVIDLNPAARRLADAPGRLVGEPVAEAFAAHRGALEPLLTGEGGRDEVSLQRGGEIRHHEVLVQTLRGADGRAHGWLVVVRDVTAQRRARDELQGAKEEAERASRAKSEFLATMSHEIRTPLNGVLASVELLLGTELNHEQREFAEIVETSGQALMALINDLLDFSKIEAGRQELDVNPFDLHRMVGRTVEMFRGRADDKGLVLAGIVEEGVPQWVMGDEARLRQILVNLVGNALKFTEHGSIDVTLRNGEDGIVELIVEDSGVGIPADKLEAIFDAFSQADSSTTRKYGGTGLGLAISRRLAQLMGGRLTAASHPEGGSAFSLAVPLRRTEASEVMPVVADDGLAERLPLRILIVEDNPVNQLTLRRMLEKLGYQPALAEDGVAAVAAAGATPYDLVFMDIQLPNMDGLEATRRILGDPAAHRPRIVAMTANATPEDRQACFDAGMDDYATKPISLARLRTKIEKWGTPDP